MGNTPPEEELSELQLLKKQHNDLKAENERLRSEISTSSTGSGSNPAEIPARTMEFNNFDTKWYDIDKRIDNAIKYKFNEVKQYSMRKNLLAHKVENIPTDIHGYKFNEWCVELINDNFIDDNNQLVLRRPLFPEDIDRAHILKTKRKDSKIVLIQFMNMTLRNEVFFAKKVLKNKTISISEHLTPVSIELLNLAQKSTGNAWRSDCKIWVEKSGGGKRKIQTPADLGKSGTSKQSGNGPRSRNTSNKNAAWEVPTQWYDKNMNAYYDPRSNDPTLYNNSSVVYPADPRNPAFINFQNANNYENGYGYNDNFNNGYDNNRGRGQRRGRGKH